MPLGKPGRLIPSLACLLALSACAEPFVYQSPDSAAPTLSGTASLAPSAPPPANAGAAEGGIAAASAATAERCPPLDFKLSIASGGTIAGDVSGAQGHYYASGELYENGNILVQLWKPTYWPNGPDQAPGEKPFAVWRGTVADQQVRLYEQPPATCRRSLAVPAGEIDAAAITRAPQ
ncbi:hypothetical protein SAMN07250955_10361 [Arboricoccus pini]|uniref:Uncharacterized protein n=1 Tax=Arboricoccus pini TaxID=1963835 RepID=A0A212QRI9_9PROT|nr:hypothetical protein [Arboricoccus pini]SNB62195.1 hypothetical protein SAMN07250955_10361 [Arboricoccus pini]